MNVFLRQIARSLRVPLLALFVPLAAQAQILNPTITISPGAQFSVPAGSQSGISASANAYSGRTVKQVEFFIDGALAATDKVAPFGFLMTAPAVGAHTLVARVTDSADVTTDATVAFETTAPYSQLPSVALQIPASGSSMTIGSVLYMAASATDLDGGIQNVSFYLDGNLVATDSSVPYSAVTLPNNPGVATVTAVARDNSGNTASATATVNVLGTAQSVPSVLLTKPSESGLVYAGQPFLFEAIANPGDSSSSISVVNFTVNGSQLTGTREARQVGFSNIYRIEDLVFSTPGNYVISAVATDSRGVQVQSTISQTVTVVAPQGAAPTVSIAQPSAAAGTLTLTSLSTLDLVAFASDADGTVTSVEFFVDRGTRAQAIAQLGSETTGSGDTQVTRRFVAGVTLTEPGAGYLVLPTVVINSGSGSGASAVVSGTGVNGALSGVQMTNGGSGYTDATVRFLGGGLYERTSLGAATLDSANGTWRTNFSPGLLGTGPHHIYAIARDNVGNVSLSSRIDVQIVGATSRPPSVTLITSSTTGKVGAPLTLSATATDPDGVVSSVEFLANGTSLGVVTTSPFTLPWTPTGEGNFVLIAQATDATGNIARSLPVTVRVGQNAPPQTTIIAPVDGSFVDSGKVVDITARAIDPDGAVTRVEFFVNGTSIGSDDTSPYTISWTPPSAGDYAITAAATDSLGLVGETSPVVHVFSAFEVRPSPLIDVETFINTTYSDMLGVFPSDEQLEEHIKAFNAGTLDRAGLIASLINRPYFEETVDFTALYRAMMGAWPNAAELSQVRISSSAGAGGIGNDDHGNSIATATPLTNATTAGALESFGDVDFFRFTVPGTPGSGDVVVTLQTTGGTDTFGELQLQDGTIIATNDDSGFVFNFLISRPLTPGTTYYLAVRGWSFFSLGSYTLSVTGIDLQAGGSTGGSVSLSTAASNLLASSAYTDRFGAFDVSTDPKRRAFFTQIFRNLYGTEPTLQQVQLGATAIQQLGAPSYLAAIAGRDKITIGNAFNIDPITNAPDLTAMLRAAALISTTLKVRPTPAQIATYGALTGGQLTNAVLSDPTYQNRFITVVSPPQSQNLAPGARLDLSVDATGTQPMTFQWYRNGTPINGATSQFLSVPSVTAADAGLYAVEISNTIASVFTPPAVVTVGSNATLLANLSTRGYTAAADDALIVGFVVNAATPRQILVRAAGPALKSFGVVDRLGDPAIQLFRGETVLASNNNWSDGGQAATVSNAAAQVGAFSFSPGSTDAGLVTSLPSGSYTVVLGGGSGNSVVEIYDLSAAGGDVSGKLINVSTRGRVTNNTDRPLIGGFVVSGTATARVMVRALGPALNAFGVGGALADPRIVIRRSDGSTVATNDNWGDSDAASLTAATSQMGAVALTDGSKDAAALLSLPAGSYTAEVQSVDGTSGVTLIEVYQVN